MKIEFSGTDLESLERYVLDKASARITAMVKQRFEDEFSAEIRRACEASAAELVREKLEPEIDKVLADGFKNTDSYGSPKGPNITLAEFIRSTMQQNRYGKNWLGDLVKHQIAALWKTDMKQEVEAAKAAMRKAVDDRLGEELAKAARQAAGIR